MNAHLSVAHLPSPEAVVVAAAVVSGFVVVATVVVDVVVVTAQLYTMLYAHPNVRTTHWKKF